MGHRHCALLLSLLLLVLAIDALSFISIARSKRYARALHLNGQIINSPRYVSDHSIEAPYYSIQVIAVLLALN